MHNLKSQNQLSEWNHLISNDYCMTATQQELQNDYFECIVESNSYEQERYVDNCFARVIQP